jgi:glycosyltransferase involved in cell wall biosynthesis
MKVGIDARFAVRKPRRGIGTYSIHLLKELIALDQINEFILYVDRDDFDDVLPAAPNVKVRRLWPSFYPLWEQVSLPLAAYRDELDVLHNLGNTAPLYLPSTTRLVLSLMDVMFLQSSDLIPKPSTFYQRAGRLYRALVSPVNALRSHAVITISEFSRNDILERIPDLSPQRVIPIHIACDPTFSTAKQLRSYITDRPFLLCLGANDPRKNTLRIVEAYIHALNSRGLEHDLVITGYANWEGSPVHCLVKKSRTETRVKFLSFVSVEDLSALYQQATALLYVSLYEGFGIPILEAFAAGCPVIASNTTSIPEVAGDAAIYVDPTNLSEIEEAVVRLCNDPALQYQLKARGQRRAKQFSWGKTAGETLAVYRRVSSINEGFRE